MDLTTSHHCFFLFLTYRPAAFSSKPCLTPEYSSLQTRCFIRCSRSALFRLLLVNCIICLMQIGHWPGIKQLLDSWFLPAPTNCRESKILLLRALAIYNKRFFFCPPETPGASLKYLAMFHAVWLVLTTALTIIQSCVGCRLYSTSKTMVCFV